MTAVAHLLFVSGSTRRGSTNTAVLRTAQTLASDGVSTTLYEAMAELPAFNPDDDHEPLHPGVAELRQQIAAADAVLFCTPEYAGAMPGSFKNLLDWTVGGGEIYGKPVAWINVSSVAAPTGGGDAQASLAKVLGYVGADIVEPACAWAPMTRDAVGADGVVTDPEVRHQLAKVLQELVGHVQAPHPAKHGRDLSGMPSTSPTYPARDVLTVERQFFDALVHGDLAALGEILADDFLIIEVMNGTVVAREDFINLIASKQVTFESITSPPDHHAVVRLYGPTAVVVGQTGQRLRLADGHTIQIASRYTHLYLRDEVGEGWRLTSAQGTPISNPPQT